MSNQRGWTRRTEPGALSKSTRLPSPTSSSLSPHASTTTVFSKRWKRPSPPPAAAPVRPHTVAEPGPRAWDAGLAGYVPPARVTEDQIRSAQVLVKAPTRVRQMVRDPVLVQAAENMGLTPADLIPKPQASFMKAEGTAAPVDAETAAAQWDSYLYRQGRKLALVVQERERLLAQAEMETKKKEETTRKLVKTFTQHVDAEAKQLEKEEKELEKIAYTIALERAQWEEKEERLRQNQERRERQLQQREKWLAGERERLRERGRKRDELIAKKNAHIKKLEQEEAEALRREWEAKEERVAAAQAQLEEERLARRQAREADWEARMARKHIAYKLEAEAKVQLAEKLKAKEERAETVALKLEAERHTWRVRKSMSFRVKRDNAARVKVELYNRKVSGKHKVMETEERLAALATMKQSLAEERKARNREVELARSEYRRLQKDVRQRPPGPHDYNIVRSSVKRTGLGPPINKFVGKDEFDVTVERAAALPAPSKYKSKSSLSPVGGKIGKTSGKSDLDWLLFYKKSLPGTGEYNPQLSPSKSTITISTSFPSDLDRTIARAKVEPSPTLYSPPRLSSPPPRLETLSKTMHDLGATVGLKPVFSPLASTAKKHHDMGKTGTLKAFDFSQSLSSTR